MGRRPIGERAMTNAERVRRHRAAKAQEAAVETLAVAERDERIRQLEAEVRRLQERVHQLERERPRASSIAGGPSGSARRTNRDSSLKHQGASVCACNLATWRSH